ELPEPVAAANAGDARDQQEREQNWQLEHLFPRYLHSGWRREEAGREEQAVTGQEKAQKQPVLGEDDQEQEEVAARDEHRLEIEVLEVHNRPFSVESADCIGRRAPATNPGLGMRSIGPTGATGQPAEGASPSSSETVTIRRPRA